MLRHLGLIPPIIALSVRIPHSKPCLFLLINIIQTRNIDCNKLPTHLRNIASMERMHSTLLAKIIMHLIRPHIVIRNIVPGREKLELGRLDFDGPVAQFATDGAVAFTGAFGEVDWRFVFDCAADTAAVVDLGHVGLFEVVT